MVGKKRAVVTETSSSGKLVEFMKTLLNHSADSVRVQERIVEGSLDELRVYYDTVRATETYLSERYNDVHAYPRMEFERRVDDHVMDQRTKFEEYMKTRNKTALFEYVTAKPPVRSNGIEIYTRYI